MNNKTRDVIQRHWVYANSRDWDAFERILDPALHYEVPQTREYIETGAGYLDMFRTWPGDWKATVRTLVCEDTKAVCIIDFVIGSHSEVGISVFEVTDGKVVSVTDYWPETYEPPVRQSVHMKRRAQ